MAIPVNSDIAVAGICTAKNLKRGSGSPEGIVVGEVGDLYEKTDSIGGLFIKETNSGNTGWKQIITGSTGGPSLIFLMAGANLGYPASPTLLTLTSIGSIPSPGVAPLIPVLQYVKDVTRVASWEYGILTGVYNGGDVTITLQWSPTSVTAGSVCWGIAFATIVAGQVITGISHSTVHQIPSVSSGIIGDVIQEVFTLTNSQLNGVQIGNGLIGFIFRLPSDGTDTYLDAANLISIKMTF